MALLTIETSDEIEQFIDDQVAARGFENRSEYVRVTLALRMLESEDKDLDSDCFMYRGKPIMTREQEFRFTRSMLATDEELERGECSVFQIGRAHV